MAVLDAPAERVFDAAAAALEGYPTETDREKGVLTTSWGPERETDESSLLFGNRSRERLRFEVRVRSLDGFRSEVFIRARAERRAIGGPRMLRWRRADAGSRSEEELLARIREGL